MRSRLPLLLLLTGVLLLLPWAVVSASSKYGSGLYGRCTYMQCGITITSTGNVNTDVSPSGSLACTIVGDTVSVLTHSSSGYTLTATNSTTNTALISGGNSIASTSGTISSPQTLNNTWGFRVDGLGSMGSGPTSAVSNAGPSSLTFAGFPSSAGTPATLASSSAYNATAIETQVWIGVCADTTVASGSYTTTVTYTAVTN